MLKNVLIGGNVADTTAAAPHLLTSGQIGVYKFDAAQTANNGYTLLTVAITAADAKFPIVIAQGVPAGKSVKMFTIAPGQKRAYLNTAFAAPIPNVYNVGFDGTAYDLVSGAAGTYSYSVRNTTLGNVPFPTLTTTPSYLTVGAANSAAIANDVVKDFNAQSFRAVGAVMQENFFAVSENISNGVTTQLQSSGTPANVTATVINGSTSVVLTFATGTLTLAAGDFLRVGHATTKTYAVYKIASGCSAAATGVAIQLDSPYVNSQIAVGASLSTIALGSAAAATIAAATAGIRVTEIGNVFNGTNVQAPQPNKTMIVACSVNAAGTPVQTNTVVAKSYVDAAGAIASGVYTEGSGTYAQIFKKELIASGFSGFQNRSYLPDAFPLFSVDGVGYATIGLEYDSASVDYTAQSLKRGETMEAILALYTGAGQNARLATILGSANW